MPVKGGALPVCDRLKKLFTYDEISGWLVWRFREPSDFSGSSVKSSESIAATCNTKFAFRRAGYISTDGYIRVCIDSRMYLAHRLIWALNYGEDPEELDHINGNRSDNRLSNLRLVSRRENAQNMCVRSDNTSGQVGVSMDKRRKKWHAYVNAGGGRINIGWYDNLNDAISARQSAEVKYGFHENHGRAAA